jgi:triosephosphate isomerase
MRRSLVIGNWKMHGSLDRVRELLAGLNGVADDPNCEVAVCPVSIHLHAAAQQLGKGNALALGAQNVSAADSGAFTGEVSAAMVAELGVKFVLVGHSERRELFAESDQLVAEKAAAVLAQGMTPVVCVGESLAQRQAAETQEVVLRQLNAVAQQLSAAELGQCVVAYEPVWAIGTGETATPAQAQEVHATLRGCLSEVSESAAQTMRILYGGSVKAANAGELFAQPDIDGGLVGGASLDAKEFSAICRQVKRLT